MKYNQYEPNKILDKIDFNSLKNSTIASDILFGRLVQKMSELNLSNADFKLLINDFIQDIKINGLLEAYSTMMNFLSQSKEN
jgi:hypothetical protein